MTLQILKNVFDALPSYKIKDTRILGSDPKVITTALNPASTRLIVGATALMSQPFIDLHNRRVEEKTRRISAYKTIAKILVGTATGVLIRTGCVKLITKYTQSSFIRPGKTSKNRAQALLHRRENPLYPTSKRAAGMKDDMLKNYRSAMGTFLALGVMLFTNFLIDAPLTKWLTNIFIKKDEGDK